LAHVKQSGDAADIPQLFIKETEFPASQSQHYSILRRLFYKFGIIVTAGFGSVATGYQEEMLNCSAFNAGDDFICYPQNGISGKTGHHKALVFI
jgi:hypothetical protein